MNQVIAGTFPVLLSHQIYISRENDVPSNCNIAE